MYAHPPFPPPPPPRRWCRPLRNDEKEGNDRSVAAGIHSRYNILGCISPPFVKSFVRFVCVRVGFGISFSRDS